MSLPNIAKIFNRDHTTIMNSIETIERKLITDSMLDFEIKEIVKEVTPNN
jgi:chromosomal replication initiation ATPase DnaA